MKYVSTRGQSEKLTFSEAVSEGLAPDGGLYVPETMPDISHKEVKEIQKKSPSKPKKEKSAPPVSKVEEVSEEIEDTEDNGDSVPDNSVIEIVSDRYKPCLLSESEIAALSRYITQLLELASDTDYEVISALADKLRR